MTKTDLLNFMAHVDEREKKYGIQDGFRFHSYFTGTEMVPAEYPIDGEEPGEQGEQAAGMRAKNKKSRKGKEKELAPPNHSDTNSRQPNAARQDTRRTNAAGPSTRQPNPTGPLSDSNIDPSLLAAGTVPPLSSDDENENAPEPGVRRIGDAEMAVLVKLGHPPVMPINGPSDGLPQYEVSATAYEMFMSKLISQQVPRSRGRPRKSQKVAEDSLSMVELNTNPSKNTRSRANKEAEATKKGPRRSTRQKK